MYSVHLPNPSSLSHPVSIMTLPNLLFIFFNFHYVYKALKKICSRFTCFKLVYKFLQLACFAQYAFYENYPYWYKLFIHFLLLLRRGGKNTQKNCTKKIFMTQNNHDVVITHLESDILECEIKWALGSITTNKASGSDGIPIELFQILKDDAVNVLHSI